MLIQCHDTKYFLFRIFFKTDDIIEYFANLAEILSFEELEHIAKILFNSYTSSTAQYESLEDVRDGSSNWATHIPLGSLWDPAALTTSDIFTPWRS